MCQHRQGKEQRGQCLSDEPWTNNEPPGTGVRDWIALIHARGPKEAFFVPRQHEKQLFLLNVG
jgi:hypothetical protein